FLFPFLIAIFYAWHADKFYVINSFTEYAVHACGFLLFWIGSWPVPVVSVSGILLTAWRCQWRGCTVVFSTILLLYCVSPAINAKVLANRFFFVPRQYLYYSLVYPLFCLMLACVLPEYWKMLMKRFSKHKFK